MVPRLCIITFYGGGEGHEHYTPQEGQTVGEINAAIEHFLRRLDGEYLDGWIAYYETTPGSHLMPEKEVTQ